MKGMGLNLFLAGSLALGLGASVKKGPATVPVATTAPSAVQRDPAAKAKVIQSPTTHPTAGANDWPAAEAFIKEHSPRRWAALESLQPDSNARPKIQAYITERYRSLMDEKKKDPAMYKLELKELELEDQIFGLVSGHHRRRDDDAFEAQLRKETASLVDTRLAMRKLRITRLEKAVNLAKARLDKDEQRRDQLVEKEMRTATKHAFPLRHREDGPATPHEPRNPTTRHAGPHYPTTRHATTSPAGRPAHAQPGQGTAD
jgi:hypothetical protein